MQKNDSMKGVDKMEIKEKLKKHKVKIIVGAAATLSISIAAYVLLKNNKVSIPDVPVQKNNKASIPNVPLLKNNEINGISDIKDIKDTVVDEIKVQGHKRKLHEGWSASESAKEFARLDNMPLAENETYVRSYKKIA